MDCRIRLVPVLPPGASNLESRRNVPRDHAGTTWAVDFQGLIKSALVAHFARPERIVGYGPRVVRERPASWFYSTTRGCEGSARGGSGDGALWPLPERRRSSACAFPDACGSSRRVHCSRCRSRSLVLLPAGLPNNGLSNTMRRSRNRFAWEARDAAGDQRRAGIVAVKSEGAVRHESGIAGLIDATRRAALVDRRGQRSAASCGGAAENPAAAIFGAYRSCATARAAGIFRRFARTALRTTHRRGDAIERLDAGDYSGAGSVRCLLHVWAATRNADGSFERDASPPPVFEALCGRRGAVCAFRRDFSRLERLGGCHGRRTRYTIGLPISICGLALRAWAAGHLAKNQRLAQSGPYAATRNPLYLGTLITAMGLAIAGDSIWLALLFAVIFLLVYLPAIELEEQHLMAILFRIMREFAARVPLLVPKWPESGAEIVGPDSFSTSPYLEKRGI